MNDRDTEVPRPVSRRKQVWEAMREEESNSGKSFSTIPVINRKKFFRLKASAKMVAGIGRGDKEVPRISAHRNIGI